MDISTYINYLGQLVTTTRNKYGETVQSSASTVSCFVWENKDMLEESAGRNTLDQGTFMLLPSSVTVSIGDHVKTVVDSLGNVVISSGKVKNITSYRGWKVNQFSPFTVLELEPGDGL